MPEEPVTEEQRAHDEQVRRNIEIAFGFADINDEGGQQQGRDDQEELSEAELRLTRTLQAAGLL